ncbi:hypothetical protein M7I_5603 [Glarea lozoyensis 74030]|uniref:Uncharacterized protein n=1 Tax=Glarea lozoyensis (strain ATCC 74030 / MF5533) TaxID=1104152 RepID=H0ESC4_GLAL7|nr:hypothetical protein M7I_5603 [Glarea lozoyensis 74030]
MELNNHYTETSGTGSGSILPDQINQSNVRLRRVARDIGYSVSIPAWKTCSPTIWTKVQSLAGAIVAFNILTLDSLQFASPGYEAVIGDGYEDYKTLLAKQTQLSGLSRIQSGAQLDTRIAKKDSERAQKNPSHVPAINYVDRGMRLDEYVDKAITTEQMTRCFLKNVISRSKGMLIIIREVIATEILALDLETMSILKQKVSAQLHDPTIKLSDFTLANTILFEVFWLRLVLDMVLGCFELRLYGVESGALLFCAGGLELFMLVEESWVMYVNEAMSNEVRKAVGIDEL